MNENKNRTIELPNQIVEISTIRSTVFSLIGIFGVQIFSAIVSLIVIGAYLSLQNNQSTFEEIVKNPEVLALVNNITYLTLFVSLISCCIFAFKKIFSSFKQIKNIAIGVIVGLCLIGFNFIYTFFVSALNIGSNSNQENVQQIALALPVFSLIIIGFIAPACEELTYRIGLFTLISKWKIWAAYVISALIFAIVHFDFNFTSEGYNLGRELINLPNYLICGLLLSFAYHKGGFAASFIAHAMNNLLSVILILGA